MIPTPDEFWQLEREKIHDLEKGRVTTLDAFVKEVLPNNRVLLRFQGEDKNSSKRFICMNHYVPIVGDRVLVVKDIVIGGWSVGS